jgi:antitoxin FitA
VSNVQVKHLDPELHDALRRRAAEVDQTISEYVLELVRRDLRRPSRHEWLERVRALRGTGRSSSEIVAILDDGRHREQSL